MKRPIGDPERWSDRLPETPAARRFRAPAEDDLGALFRRVRESTLPSPSARPALAAARARGPRKVRLVGRLALAAILVAVSGGAVKAGRSIWRVMAARPLSLVVPSGSSAVVHGRAHRRLTLVGPARLDLDRREADHLDLTLEGGAVTAEAGDEALVVETNGRGVTLPPGSIGTVAGAGGALTAVDALAGELRVAPQASRPAIVLPAGHHWPEPLPPVERPPSPMTAPSPMVAVGHPRAAQAASDPPRVEASTRRAPRNGDETPDGEASLLARAFHAVRVDGDGEAALQALDERARRFPNGPLSDEARVARVEALLAVGRTSEALPLLLEIRDRPEGLTRGIQLARAEILAEQNRCPEATSDFDDLVAAEVRDDTGERALYGRAACHLRDRETARARQDLRRYVEVYPDGRFIGAVRRAATELDSVAAP
jgi:TolA-binding protein